MSLELVPMELHEITIEVDLHQAVDNHGKTYTTTATRYRWCCSCGRRSVWRQSRNNVTWGGKRHILLATRDTPAPGPCIEEHW
jgi:hypothetical protein